MKDVRPTAPAARGVYRVRPPRGVSAALWLIPCALLLITTPLVAVMRTAPDLDLARASAAAVRGVVTSVSVVRDADVDALYTLVGIDVSRSWGFPAPPAHVDVKLLGGTLGGAALVVGGQARFAPGEDVIVLLDVRPRDHSLSVTGLEFGKWSVAPSMALDPAVSRAPDLRDVPGVRERRTARDVEALAALAGTRVRLPDGWTPAVAAAQASPRDPRMRIAQDSAGATTARWHEADWGAAVSVDSASGGHALFPGGGFAQLLRAIATWSGASALRLQPGVLRGPRCFATSEPADGRVSISYDDPCDEIADTSPTLALGGVFYDASDVRVVHGTPYGRATRGVVVLDNVAAKFANFSTGCYEDVLTHELGHAIGLPHTTTQPSVMYPWLAPDCINRVDALPLQAPDLAAALERYPGATTGDSPPGVPGGLSAYVSGDTVTLSWLPASGTAASAYQLQAGSVPGAADVAVVTLGATSFVTTSVPRGVYYVRIVALNAFGASAPGPDVMVVVGNGLPGMPVGLMAAAGPAGAVRVLWQPPSIGPLPDGYALLVGTTPGRPTTRIPMATTALSASGVAAGTYYVRAVSVNGAGAGPASPEITVIVP